MQSPADNKDNPLIKAQVTIQVLDVDEQPEFSKSIYNFNVIEEMMVNNIGVISARDPDQAKKAIRYYNTFTCY